MHRLVAHADISLQARDEASARLSLGDVSRAGGGWNRLELMHVLQCTLTLTCGIFESFATAVHPNFAGNSRYSMRRNRYQTGEH